MGNYDNSANVAIDMIFKFIRERMEERGISQYKLAKMIGTNESTLSRNFKKETLMPLSTYLKICGALELRPYLVTAEGDENEMNRIDFN